MKERTSQGLEEGALPRRLVTAHHDLREGQNTVETTFADLGNGVQDTPLLLGLEALEGRGSGHGGGVGIRGREMGEGFISDLGQGEVRQIRYHGLNTTIVR